MTKHRDGPPERAMLGFLIRFLLVIRSRLQPQARLQAEIVVLRQQVVALSRKSARARLRNLDPLILLWLRFPSLPSAMTVVKPEAVIRLHRHGFQAYRALGIRVTWVNEI